MSGTPAGSGRRVDQNPGHWSTSGGRLDPPAAQVSTRPVPTPRCAARKHSAGLRRPPHDSSAPQGRAALSIARPAPSPRGNFVRVRNSSNRYLQGSGEGPRTTIAGRPSGAAKAGTQLGSRAGSSVRPRAGHVGRGGGWSPGGHGVCGWEVPGGTRAAQGVRSPRPGQAQGPGMPGPDGAPACTPPSAPAPPSQRWTWVDRTHPRAKGAEENTTLGVSVPGLGRSGRWTARTGRRASERVPVSLRSRTAACLPVTPEKPGAAVGGTGDRRQMQAGLLGSAQPAQEAGLVPARPPAGWAPGARRAAAPGLSLGHRGALALDGRGVPFPSSPQRPPPRPPARPCRSGRLLLDAGGTGWGQEWGSALDAVGSNPGCRRTQLLRESVTEGEPRASQGH